MIKLGGLVTLKPISEAEVFTATSKETGTTSVFKSKDARDAAIKAGTHEKRKDDKDGGVKDPTDKPKVNIFKRDSDRDSKERLKKMKKDREEKEFNSLYNSDDCDEKVDSLKDKMSDKDFKKIKDAIENLKYMQYDLEDIDRDEDNEEWAMQSDAIDVEVEDLKGVIKQAISKDKEEPKPNKSSEPDYDKYTSKAQTVTDFIKGDLSTDDIQKIADKNFGSEVATPKELDDFLNNKFIQGMMADQYGVDKDEMVSKVKELKAALFGSDKEEPKKDEPTKDSSGGRAGNPEVNKAVRKKAEKIGLTPEKLGREEYELKMVQAAHEALTDSNFHSEARKLISIIEDNPELAKNPADDPNKPGLGEPGYEEWVKGTAWGSKYGDTSPETDELGQAAAQEAGWGGKDALDGIAFELKMRGFKDLAAKMQSVFDDEKNESSMRLTKMEFKGKE